MSSREDNSILSHMDIPGSNQKGFIAQLLILLLLGAGLAVGIYLVQNRTTLFSRASGGSVSQPITPAVGFSVEPEFDTYAGREVGISVMARSDFDRANLFAAKLKFNKDLLRVTKIDTDTGFIKNWVEHHYNNDTGEISLVGGIPNPGLQTQIGSAGHMAVIYFQTLKEGKAEISVTNDSALYRNYDNSNVIGLKQGATITIKPSSAEDSTVPPVAESSHKASLSLDLSSGATNRGCSFSVSVNLDTDGGRTDGTDAILLYDPSKLTATSIVDGHIYADYPADEIDSKNGKVIITGLAQVSSPFSSKGVLATINFKVKDAAPVGATQINFDFDPNNKTKHADSNVVENETVRDILDSVGNGSYTIGTGACTSQSTTSVPTSNNGDVNGNGKVDLVDMSKLLADFGKSGQIKADMNGDGKVNALDVLLLRNTLIKNGMLSTK